MNFDILSYGNYVVFAILAFFIVVSSYVISHIVDAIEKRTRFSGVLVAGTVVAFVSSMPEFTSSLVGIFTTNNPSVAAGNLLGGEIYRTAMLAFTLLFFLVLISKAKTTMVQVSLTVSQIVVFAAYFLVMWLARNQFSETISTVIFTTISVVVLFIYAFNLWVMVKKSKTEVAEEMKEYKDDAPKGLEAKFRHFFSKIKIWKMVLIFVASSVIIVAASFFIAFSTNWILTSWGWESTDPKTGFGYSLLLGIVTSIPETITVISLLKLKNVNAAFGDILGSNMFTCLILSVVDLVYWHGNDTLFGKQSDEALSIAFWCFVSMSFIGIILLVNWLYRNSRHGKIYYSIQISLLILVVLCYVCYLVISGLGINIFYPINPDPGPPSTASGWNDMYSTLQFSKMALGR